ncbi:MAG: type II toxin-antitoxin system ParD family antitoxin [Nitrospinae bacterium CG11_big_fil_rev_8_21_14_0_20_45_15]|nr:MAG: type II toxin-antitoxin system ParD family antitoxin [Nitrospinae bacterium CG11_big_fil_rev_8_21_14_0_20_45_15]
MHLKLGHEFDDFIQAQVATGMYGNATEVIRDALRHMKDRQDEKNLENIRALLAVGENQIAKGETVAYGSGLLDRLTKEAVQNSKMGKPVKNEIKPRT